MLNKLKQKRAFFRKSEFRHNVLTLMTGATIAQAIPIAISPILTRIYTPEDFGVFALYMSVASIMSVLATGRYELAIMLPKKDKDAINIVALSILISFFVSFISFLIVFVFNTQIANILSSPQIANWLYFIPITVLLTGIYQSFNYWSNRKKQYKRLATSRVVQSGTTAASNLAMGFGGFGSSGLILGGILGQGVAATVLGKFVFREDRGLFAKINRLKIAVLAKKYKKMPIFNLPNALIDGFRLSGMMILISKYFSVASLGQFSLAWKILQIPISLIGGSISQVFFQEISSLKNEELYAVVTQFIKKASMLSLPMFLIIYFFSEEIFLFVFGHNWKLAGKIASILSPWVFLNFLSMPLANILIILNKQEIILLVSIIYMIVPLVILILFHTLPLIYILHLISISMSSILIFYIWLVFFILKKEG